MNATDLCPKCGLVMAVHGKYVGSPLMCDFRDESDLTPDLVGFEGWRVEVVDAADGSTAPRRFYVGKSTGWKPCHLEIHNRRSRGGSPARKAYASVARLYKR